jgi:integrase
MSRPRRANGAGSVYIKHGSYYGRWLTARGHTNRRLGPVRQPGTASGLTRRQAEARLRELMDEVVVVTDVTVTVTVAGRAWREALEAKGRATSHIQTVESHLRVHIEPFFGEKPIDRVTDSDVTRFLVALRRKDLKPKTARNVLSTLHSLFELALRRRWVNANPCKTVDAPVVEPSGEIRFLKQAELVAVLERGVPDDALGKLERPLYLMAAMTGLRQGELLALRWLDLDDRARKVRVRQAFVRGEFKAPKSRRGTRGVPMAEELGEALDQLREAALFTDDDDLVFANPTSGKPLDRSTVYKRFKKACRRAGVRVVRFHDLRHTFGTRIAASGEVSLRTLQEWMGHRDAKTTLIYADYQPAEHESEIVSRAFR